MFLFSFCILATLRLAYRHTACLAVISVALSLWAWWQSNIFYRWIGPPPDIDPKQLAAWLAGTSWAITTCGSDRRNWFYIIPAALVCTRHNPESLAGALTGMALCLPIPQLPIREPDEFGISRT